MLEIASGFWRVIRDRIFQGQFVNGLQWKAMECKLYPVYNG